MRFRTIPGVPWIAMGQAFSMGSVYGGLKGSLLRNSGNVGDGSRGETCLVSKRDGFV